MHDSPRYHALHTLLPSAIIHTLPSALVCSSRGARVSSEKIRKRTSTGKRAFLCCPSLRSGKPMALPGKAEEVEAEGKEGVGATVYTGGGSRSSESRIMINVARTDEEERGNGDGDDDDESDAPYAAKV